MGHPGKGGFDIGNRLIIAKQMGGDPGAFEFGGACRASGCTRNLPSLGTQSPGNKAGGKACSKTEKFANHLKLGPLGSENRNDRMIGNADHIDAMPWRAR
jgi:hypothetical protein